MKRRYVLFVLILTLAAAVLAACGEKSDFVYEKTEGGVVITGYEGESKDVVIPESIGDKSVVAIGSAAFDAKPIQSVIIPESVTRIEKYAFRRCGKLTSVTIKGNIKEIADGAFYYCIGLEKIDLPDGIERIGVNAFGGAGLTEIELPDSVKTVDAYAFYECHEMKRFIGGKGLEVIGESALATCVHLEELVLENGLKTVGAYALSACISMKDIKFPETVDKLTEGVFAGMPYEEYTVQGSIKAIERNAFQACKSMKKIYLPPTVEKIDAEAFTECKGVTICGVRDSEAEIFADTYGFKFEEYKFD